MKAFPNCQGIKLTLQSSVGICSTHNQVWKIVTLESISLNGLLKMLLKPPLSLPLHLIRLLKFLSNIDNGSRKISQGDDKKKESQNLPETPQSLSVELKALIVRQGEFDIDQEKDVDDDKTL